MRLLCNVHVNPSERQTKPYPTDWKLCPHLRNFALARQTNFQSVRHYVGLAFTTTCRPRSSCLCTHTIEWHMLRAFGKHVFSRFCCVRLFLPTLPTSSAAHSWHDECAGLLRVRALTRMHGMNLCGSSIRIRDGTTENIYRSRATVFAPVWFETFECKHINEWRPHFTNIENTVFYLVREEKLIELVFSVVRKWTVLCDSLSPKTN